MKTELDFKSILLLQLCYLIQNVRSKHHCFTCKDSDEESESQENISDLDDIPVMSMESPISIPQMDPMSIKLPQILIPQMSMPSITMTAGSFPTSLLAGQRLVFFRIPSSYLNIMQIQKQSTSTSKNPTTTTTSIFTTTTATAQTTKSTTTEATIMKASTTVTTSQSNINDEKVTKLPSPSLNILSNSGNGLGNEEDSDRRSLILNTEQEDGMLESVLQNIMNEFSDRIIKAEENNDEFNGRRHMVPTSLSKTKPSITQFKILPIPDSMAKKLLAHLRAVKQISTSR